MFSRISQFFNPPPKRSLEELLADTAPLVIAHRGDSNHAPENTLPAFKRAAKMGCEMIEIDFAETADGVPVVLHDNTLDRTTNAVEVFAKNHNLLSEHTWEEVQTLDAACHFAGKKKYTNVSVPQLKDVINAVIGNCTPLLERKAGPPETIVNLLAELDLTESVIVEAFDWEYLEEIHKLQPAIPLAALGSKDITDESLQRLEAIGIKIVVWSQMSLTRRVVNRLVEAGMTVCAYTVDHRSRADELVNWGVRGLISNEPGKLLKHFR